VKRLVISLFLVLSLMLGAIAGCSTPPPTGKLEGKLQIFHAGSLTIPFAQVSEEFNQLHPDVEILAEGAGSQATIRKVTELHKECGVIGSADYTIILQLMSPEYADWYIVFATNQMCIAYTDKSQFGDEINEDNWYEILQRDGVKYGRSDPNQDPCGYRTLLVWQLAEAHYGVPGMYDNLYETEGDLMRPKSVELPEINLSSEEHKDFYTTAEVEISGKQPGEKITKKGKPIVYGVTIPSNFVNKELAIAWVDFLLSPEGMAIMEANGQPPVIPAMTNDESKLPEELKKYIS